MAEATWSPKEFDNLRNRLLWRAKVVPPDPSNKLRVVPNIY